MRSGRRRRPRGRGVRGVRGTAASAPGSADAFPQTSPGGSRLAARPGRTPAGSTRCVPSGRSRAARPTGPGSGAPPYGQSTTEPGACIHPRPNVQRPYGPIQQDSGVATLPWLASEWSGRVDRREHACRRFTGRGCAWGAPRPWTLSPGGSFGAKLQQGSGVAVAQQPDRSVGSLLDLADPRVHGPRVREGGGVAREVDPDEGLP